MKILSILLEFPGSIIEFFLTTWTLVIGFAFLSFLLWLRKNEWKERAGIAHDSWSRKQKEAEKASRAIDSLIGMVRDTNNLRFLVLESMDSGLSKDQQILIGERVAKNSLVPLANNLKRKLPNAFFEEIAKGAQIYRAGSDSASTEIALTIDLGFFREIWRQLNDEKSDLYRSLENYLQEPYEKNPEISPLQIYGALTLVGKSIRDIEFPGINDYAANGYKKSDFEGYCDKVVTRMEEYFYPLIEDSIRWHSENNKPMLKIEEMDFIKVYEISQAIIQEDKTLGKAYRDLLGKAAGRELLENAEGAS
jgi:hypothetical protein